MQSFSTLLPEQQHTSVALGFFDGIHRGHRRVLCAAAAQRENGLLPVCLTFAESPKALLSSSPIASLMTRGDKLRTLESIGMEHVFFTDFRAVMNMTAREFFEKILVDTLNARRLYCGFNYRFGRNAEGDAWLLNGLCAEKGMTLTVAPPETDHGEVVCSSLIRRLIMNGEVRRANRLLCGSFGVREVIRHGRHLGHRLGTPTINQPLTRGLVIPKFGVYVSRVTLEDGKTYCGVTNIGVKPTVGGKTPLWETWMPLYTGGEIYGQTADVRLLDFIRDEQRFGSLDELKGEIFKNGQTALKIYQSFSN